MKLNEIKNLNEVTGDKSFDAKLKQMTIGKSVLPDEEVRDAVKGSEPDELRAPAPKLSGAIKTFDKWCDRVQDLWHPGFPDRFAECAEEYIKTDADLAAIGEMIADRAHSFEGEQMYYFIEYVKRHPIPELSDEDDPDVREYEKQIEKYVETALKAMYE